MKYDVRVHEVFRLSERQTDGGASESNYIIPWRRYKYTTRTLSDVKRERSEVCTVGTTTLVFFFGGGDGTRIHHIPYSNGLQ